jgi:hypothetical protein
LTQIEWRQDPIGGPDPWIRPVGPVSGLPDSDPKGMLAIRQTLKGLGG